MPAQQNCALRFPLARRVDLISLYRRQKFVCAIRVRTAHCASIASRLLTAWLAAQAGGSLARARRPVGYAGRPKGCFDRSGCCSTRRPAEIAKKDLALFRQDHVQHVADTSPRPWCSVPGPAGGPATVRRGSSVASSACGWWQACVVARPIVSFQMRVSPRQLLPRTLGRGSYTHGACIPRVCGPWGALALARQRDGGALHLPICALHSSTFENRRACVKSTYKY